MFGRLVLVALTFMVGLVPFSKSLANTSEQCEVVSSLNSAGFSRATVSGLLDPQNSEIIKQFQQKSGLIVTGQIDVNTLTTLVTLGESSVSVQSSTAFRVITDQCLTTTDETGLLLSSIIISGEKLGRTQQETSASNKVFTATDIEDQGDRSLSELLSRSANTTTNEEGEISIRGIAGSRPNFGKASLITVQVDGVNLDGTAQQGAISQLFDTEQVEVLRGPQSTSQGRNALAGAVIVKTVDPDFVPEAKLQLSAEERNGYMVGVAVGGGLSDSFAGRLVATREASDGFINHPIRNDDKFAATEKEVIRGKLLYQPVDRPEYRSLLTLSYSDWQGQPDYNMEKGEAGADPEQRRTSSVSEQTEDNTRVISASIDNQYQWTDTTTITAVTGFFDADQDYRRDFDGTDEEGGDNEIFTNTGSVTQEFRMNYEGERAKGLVGLFGGIYDRRYFVDTRDVQITGESFQNTGGTTNAVVLATDFTIEEQQDIANIAVFSEFDFDLTEKTVLTLGLRYDREYQDNIGETDTTRAEVQPNANGVPGAGGNNDQTSRQLTGIDPLDGVVFGVVDSLNALIGIPLPGIDISDQLEQAGVAPTSNGPQESSTQYSAVLPKIGLRYQMSENLSVFAQYAEAYRPGGVDVVFNTGERIPYDPEYTSTYEIGLRSALRDSTLQINSNIFFTAWKDQQVAINRDGFFITDNAAESELYGFELEADWQINRQINVFSGVGYVHTEYKDYIDGNEDNSGNEFVFAPPVTANLGATYRSNGFMATANANYRDKAYTRPSNQEDEIAEERTIVNARVGYEWDSASIYVYGRNLTDEDVITETYQFRQGYLGAPTARGYASYNEPRTFGMQFSLSL